MKILYTSIFTLLFTLSSIGQNTFNTTYTLPVWQWPPGVYFLQLLHEGVLVRTERFVVGR